MGALTRRAVFLDRDGVINQNRPDHVKTWGEFVFLPGALAALAALSRLGLPVIVVTNQSVIGRGLSTRQAVEEINRRMVAQAEEAGGRIAAVYYCPHRPEDGCGCRKPRPGLLRQAAADLGLTLSGSHLVGDAWSDVALGQAAGCRTVLVLTGRGGQAFARVNGDPAVHVAEDLAAAAEWIADCERRSANGAPGTDAGRDVVELYPKVER